MLKEIDQAGQLSSMEFVNFQKLVPFISDDVEDVGFYQPLQDEIPVLTGQRSFLNHLAFAELHYTR